MQNKQHEPLEKKIDWHRGLLAAEREDKKDKHKQQLIHNQL